MRSICLRIRVSCSRSPFTSILLHGMSATIRASSCSSCSRLMTLDIFSLRRSAFCNACSALSSWFFSSARYCSFMKPMTWCSPLLPWNPRSPDLICPSACTCRSSWFMSSMACTQRASNRGDVVWFFSHPANGESSRYCSFDDIQPSLAEDSYCMPVSMNRHVRRVMSFGSMALIFAANPCSWRLSTRMVCAMGA